MKETLIFRYHLVVGLDASFKQDDELAERDDTDFIRSSACSRCHVDFLDPADLLAHEKICNGRRMVPAFADLEPPPVGLSSDPVVFAKPAPGTEVEDDEEEEVEEEGMLQEELLGEMQGEVEDEEEVEDDDDDIDSTLQSEDDYLQGSLSLAGGGKDCEDGDNFFYGSAAEPATGTPTTTTTITTTATKGEDGKKKASGVGSNHGDDSSAHILSPYSTMSASAAAAIASGIFPTSNVTLEPMAATKAAVAQFAENNALPNDTALLKSMLMDLQKTQMIQWQVIHQLQSALASKLTASAGGGGSAPDVGPSTPLPGPLGLPPHLAHLMLPPQMSHLGLAAGHHPLSQQGLASYLSSQADKLKEVNKRPTEIDHNDDDDDEDNKKKIKQDDTCDDEHREESREGASASSKAPEATKTSTPSSAPPSTTSMPILPPSAITTIANLSNSIGSIGGNGAATSGAGPSSGAPAVSIKRENLGSATYGSASLSALQRETDALKASILPGIHMPMTPEEYRGYCQRGTGERYFYLFITHYYLSSFQ